MNTKVSLYKRVNYKRKMRDITLDDWLHKATPAAKTAVVKIREVNESDVKAAKAMKNANLPGVTISGVFDGERRAGQVTEVNPIICIDIDDLPDGMTLDELKKKVFYLPYVFYVSLSARGEGIYAMIYFNKDNDFLQTFKSLEKDFKDMGIVIDENCKDISRLRFASWDDNPLEKEGEVEMYDRYMMESPVMKTEEKQQTPLNIDDYFTYQTIKYLINNCGYRADDYQDWLMDGFRLATFGQYGHALFMHLSRNSDNFNERVAEMKWAECVRTTKMTKDCLAHYYAEAKKRLGPDWKIIVRRG